MLIIYLAALLLGGGLFLLQWLGGHDTPFHHDFSHDVVGSHDTPLSFFLSMRVWLYTFLTFGLTGTLLTLLAPIATLVTLIIAIIVGLSIGTSVGMLFRYIKRTEPPVVTLSDSVGRVGRVIIAIEPAQTGKIRLLLGGSSVDVLATATVPLERGASVVVSECVGEQVVVTPAPLELGPEKRNRE